MLEYVIVGAGGMLGSAFRERLSAAHIISLSEGRALPKMAAGPRNLVVLYCQGPTSPKANAAELQRFHVDEPLRLFQNLESRVRAFVTFGTVHEYFPELCHGNAYLSAKLTWLRMLPQLPDAFTHFQLHTLYGLPLRPGSFAAQLLQAIRDNAPFRMSLGQQVRQYHPAADVAATVLARVNSLGEARPPVTVLENHQVISLADLATGLLREFGCSDKLQLGAFPSPEGEPVELRLPSGVCTESLPEVNPVVGLAQLFREILSSAPNP